MTRGAGRIGCLLLVLLTMPMHAQDTAPVHAAPTWDVGPYVGRATNSPVTSFGVTPDRDHLFIGAHFVATFLKREWWSVAYAPEVVPILLISNTPTYRIVTDVATPQSLRQTKVETGRGVAAGFAMSPLGIEAQVGLLRDWRLFAGAAAGAVWFGRDVPVPGSRAFNYTYEAGGGAQWQYRPGWFLRAGYKFHHLSNAVSSVVNPGLNGNVVTAGVLRRLGHR